MPEVKVSLIVRDRGTRMAGPEAKVPDMARYKGTRHGQGQRY